MVSVHRIVVHDRFTLIPRVHRYINIEYVLIITYACQHVRNQFLPQCSIVTPSNVRILRIRLSTVNSFQHKARMLRNF